MNPCSKTRPVDDPYEIWKAGDWLWLVLKKWQDPVHEAKNPNARWFCLVKTPIVPEGEMGDVYVTSITSVATRIR